DSLYFPIDSTEDECVADFSFTEDEFDEMTYEFTDKSTASTNASIISWSWDFGDGGTSSSQNPTYSYTEEGSYDVTLTITDNFNCTKTSDEKKVKIKTTECCKRRGKAPPYRKDYTGGEKEWYLWTKGWKNFFVLFTGIGASTKNFHRQNNKFKKNKADEIYASYGGKIYYEDCETEAPVSKPSRKYNKKCVSVDITLWIDGSKIKSNSLGCSHDIKDEGYELDEPYLRIITPNCN
ncbi:MAG: PKD domain-containing protein, partial [Bacteroidota bacterium]|nr:PKD domain-containing protein [Bacteroidota bacterium]